MPYYTTTRDGSRHGFLAGPFRSHTEALVAVDPAKEVAQRVDPRAFFYGFGTAKADRMYPGCLNADLGMQVDASGYARLPESLRPFWTEAIHRRITGEQVGRKHTDKWQSAMRHDQRIIEDYLFGNVRNSGCSGLLHTLEMQRKYPKINKQEKD